MVGTKLELRSVSAPELVALVKRSPGRAAVSRGQALVDEFLASGDVAATVSAGSAKDRDALSVSASTFVRRSGAKVWVRKHGDTDLLLVNLAKAPDDVVRAYETRPQVGRKPKAR